MHTTLREFLAVTCLHLVHIAREIPILHAFHDPSQSPNMTFSIFYRLINWPFWNRYINKPDAPRHTALDLFKKRQNSVGALFFDFFHIFQLLVTLHKVLIARFFAVLSLFHTQKFFWDGIF